VRRFYKLVNGRIIGLPAPKRLSIMWNWGSLLGIVLIVQIIRGLVMVRILRFGSEVGFASVIHIVQDVENGWFVRLVHATGASWFFGLIYLHIGRGIWFRRFGMKWV
jgi:ubiquinol-cytochrome c reductase cytochrome b subunit